MKIQVTEKHIAAAKQRDSQHCMIADAIRDRFKARYISVDLQSIKFSVPSKDTRYVYLTPPPVQKAIIAFDQGRKLQAFDFSLNSPISADPIAHWDEATKQAQRKLQRRRASLKYVRARRAGTLPPPQKRHHAPREREFGVRVLEQ